MKNIVVPTDFSDTALAALRYAINIANEFGSVIHLINGVDIMAATGIYTDVNNMIRESSMVKLNDVIGKESKKLQGMSMIIPRALSGEISGAICDYAENIGADLIVMGTQGASGLKEVFIGTVAKGVVNGSKVPVIVVPKEGKSRKPQKIALTIDSIEIHSDKVLAPFRKLVKAFDAKATVFHFNEQYAVSDVDPGIDVYLEDIQYSTYDHYSDDRDINKAIEAFVKSEGIDLLTMIRRKRSFIDALFHKSVTSKEVFHSKVPLMILYDKG